MIHSFLEELASGVGPVPGLERLMFVRLDPDGRVLLMHLFFYVRVNAFSTQQHIFACFGEMPAEGLPPVVDIPPKAFASRRSVCAVLQIDHITHLWGYPR